jgi:thiamine monophosphate synthase
MEVAIQKLLESGLGWVVAVLLGFVVVYQYREKKQSDQNFIDYVMQSKEELLMTKDANIKSLELNAEAMRLLSDKIKVAKE